VITMDVTPTQAKMLEILADGKLHAKEELHVCCGPSSVSVVKLHILNLNKVLRPLKQEILGVMRSRKAYYKHVRMLSADE